MNQMQNTAGAQQALNQPNSAQKPESAFTGRIRSLAETADNLEYRLRAILRNLRVSPPEPPALGGIHSGSGLAVVHTTVEDHLLMHENTQGNIMSLVTELEGLFG